MSLCALAGIASAQQNRIVQPIDIAQRTTLTGNLHPKATSENDQGRVAPTLRLSYVTLTFAPSASQKAALTRLLADQQNPKSPNYHHWLTPEEYADRFGLTQDDMTQVTSWLQSQALTIANVARGRNWVAMSGSAAQIETAFQTEIHQYQVDGETHFANATEPSVPAALGAIVMSIRGLNDFRMKPLNVKPRYNSQSLCGGHCLAPNDLATIYDITAAYNNGIDGTGQTIAVAGQTDIYVSDITTFRSNYGLPANQSSTDPYSGFARSGSQHLRRFARSGSGSRMVGRSSEERHDPLRLRGSKFWAGCDGGGPIRDRPESCAGREHKLRQLRTGDPQLGYAGVPKLG